MSRRAVIDVVPPASRDTAWAGSSPAGARASWRGRTATNSAALPKDARGSVPHTRSPTVRPDTGEPGAATSPAKSIPVPFGKPRPVTRRIFPARPRSSPPFTPAACTRTSTSPGPATGLGNVPSYSTSGGPYLSYRAARISVTVLVIPSVRPVAGLAHGRGVGRAAGGAS